MEHRYLAKATGKRDYATKTEKVFEILHKMQPADGLIFQNIRDGNPPAFSGAKVSFGAMSDLVYKCMLKVWVQGSKKERKYQPAPRTAA